MKRINKKSVTRKSIKKNLLIAAYLSLLTLINITALYANKRLSTKTYYYTKEETTNLKTNEINSKYIWTTTQKNSYKLIYYGDYEEISINIKNIVYLFEQNQLNLLTNNKYYREIITYNLTQEEYNQLKNTNQIKLENLHQEKRIIDKNDSKNYPTTNQKIFLLKKRNYYNEKKEYLDSIQITLLVGVQIIIILNNIPKIHERIHDIKKKTLNK